MGGGGRNEPSDKLFIFRLPGSKKPYRASPIDHAHAWMSRYFNVSTLPYAQSLSQLPSQYTFLQ
jgi:hypothetical protein